MREIKFRALIEYNIDGEKELRWEYYYTLRETVWDNGSIGKIIVFDLQYIGRKDINGKDIYEGDLWLDDRVVCEVCFDELNLQYCGRTKQSKFPKRDDGYTYYQTNINNIKIIGNKFENPELMENI